MIFVIEICIIYFILNTNLFNNIVNTLLYAWNYNLGNFKYKTNL